MVRCTETKQIQRERERDVCVRTLNRNGADAESEREMCVCALNKNCYFQSSSENYNKQFKCVFLLFCSCKVMKHRSDI